LRVGLMSDEDLYVLCERSPTLANLRVGRVRVTRAGTDRAFSLSHARAPVAPTTPLASLRMLGRLRSSVLLRVLATYAGLRHLDVTCARKVAHQRGLAQLTRLESLRLTVPDVVSFLTPMLESANRAHACLFPRLRRLVLRNQDVYHQEESAEESAGTGQLGATYDENGSGLWLRLLFRHAALTDLDVSDIPFAVPPTGDDDDDDGSNSSGGGGGGGGGGAGDDGKNQTMGGGGGGSGRQCALPRQLPSLTRLGLTYDTESTGRRSAGHEVAGADVDVAGVFPNLERLRVNVEALDYHDPLGVGWCAKLRILDLQLDNQTAPKRFRHLLRRDGVTCRALRLIRVTRPLPEACETWTRAQGIDVVTLPID